MIERLVCRTHFGFGLTRGFGNRARMPRNGIADRLRLSLRAEAFNVLNHPNFMNPSVDDRVGTLNFGRATQMANRGFGGVQGPALQPLYESGGPRAIQLSLRLEF